MMITSTCITTRWLKVLLVAVVAVMSFAGAAQAITGQGAPPQSAIDNASATWAAKAKLLDAYGQPLKPLGAPPQSAIDNASATWRAKAKLLDADGQPLTTQREKSGTVSTSGFDWGDFGIGLGAMLGLVLL